MKILKKLLSWKKQGKDITIVNANFPSHRASYRIISVHPFFSKTAELANSDKPSEKILINIKSISMAIDENEYNNASIWL